MKDMITQIGLVVLGLFLVGVLILGSSSMKSNMKDGVESKMSEEITKLKATTSN